MKKLLLSSVALFGLTAGALAADLPRRQYVAPAPVPYVAVPVFTWTGFYIGVNAGAAFTDHNNDDFNNGFGFGSFGGSGLSVQTTGGLAPVVPLSGFNAFGNGFDRRNNDVAFAGGGQIGYNFQFTPGTGFVIGIEADIQGTTFDRRRNDDVFGFGGFGSNNGIFTAATVLPAIPGSGIAPPTGVGNGALGNVALFNGGLNGFGNGSNGFDRNRPEWFATVRGRLGYAWDRLLIYATGGVAFRDDNNRDDCSNGFGCGFGFGTGIASGAALVGTGFYTTPGAAIAGNAVVPTNAGFFFDDRNNNVGWTVGGGLEYAFTNGFLGFNNVTAKIEGLYVSFDRNNRNNNGFFGGGNVVGVSNTGAAVVDSQFAGSGFDNRRNRDDFAVVRAGLNWKFNAF
jgi:outer membrane immunogenic protein